jgi:pyruvate dehydrogenase E2 component (dihydrolipoamide acetyltransferase)
MAERMLMTALSPTMEEGTIVTWNKKEGDEISPGDLVCEVETDKATMDYESTQEGTLLAIIAKEGDSATVGQPIAILGGKGEDVSALLEEIESEEAHAAKGSTEPSTPASAPGEAAPASASAGPAVQSPQTPPDAPPDAPPVASPAAVSTSSSGVTRSSPLARKLAAQKGIDIGAITGSGPGGRVVKNDVESFVPGATAGAAAAPAGQDVTIPVDRKRAVIASRLSESKHTSPHYYLKTSVRMDRAIQARKTLNDESDDRVGFNAFLIKYVAEALKRHRILNASWRGDHILQFGSVDIGLAVDLGNGLITPVVRNCGNKGVVQIDSELKALIARAGEGKLQPEEYTGATFTISNLGSFGIEEFTAIINPPGSAILAVGSIVQTLQPAEEDEIEIVPMMKMTLSCDHRVIDGAAGARFLNDLRLIIEDPARVLY